MKIGSHVSNNGFLMLEGSIKEALSYGENCFMIYLGAPQNTVRKPLSQMHGQQMLMIANEYNINPCDIIVHAPYIVNPAQTDPSKHDFAVSFITSELKSMNALCLKYLVLHPGSHVGNGSEVGISMLIKTLNEIFALTEYDDTMILIETMAGKGSEIGRTFEELAKIIEGVHDKNRIGICLDTCHIFDGGYDIVNRYEEVINEFDRTVGLSYIKAIHLNDSKNVLGSHKDRHENLGFGNIGFDTLYKVATDERFYNIPKILESPYIPFGSTTVAPYKEEIRMLKSGTFNPSLKDIVIESNR